MNILEVDQLRKTFPVGRGALLHAVDDVSFTIGEGQSVGLVGESGCGKSTLVRLITRMLDADSGDLIFNGRNIGFIPSRHFAQSAFRAKIQMVFQDPTDSLNPRHTAFDTIAEPLRLLGGLTNHQALQLKVEQAAQQTGFALELLSRYPHQLSGGQKARVGIARAIVLRPRLLVLDEATAALDVSVQAKLLDLLRALVRDLGIAAVIVTHDLAVARLLTDRLMVMKDGVVIEQGLTDQVLDDPQHAYTQLLTSAVLV